MLHISLHSFKLSYHANESSSWERWSPDDVGGAIEYTKEDLCKLQHQLDTKQFTVHVKVMPLNCWDGALNQEESRTWPHHHVCFNPFSRPYTYCPRYRNQGHPLLEIFLSQLSYPVSHSPTRLLAGVSCSQYSLHVCGCGQPGFSKFVKVFSSNHSLTLCNPSFLLNVIFTLYNS